MLMPIRCITCGKVLADKWEEFRKRVEAGEKPAKVLDDLGITRYCCRSVMITSVDLSDDIAEFKKKLLPSENRD